MTVQSFYNVYERSTRRNLPKERAEEVGALCGKIVEALRRQQRGCDDLIPEAELGGDAVLALRELCRHLDEIDPVGEYSKLAGFPSPQQEGEQPNG